MLKSQDIGHVKHLGASEYEASTGSETIEHHDPLVSQITTKYDLSPRTKNRNASYKELLPTCPTLKLWDIQNKYKFGFIPLGDLDLPSQVSPSKFQDYPIALHAMIKDSGQTNFLEKQVNITSQLNPDVWDCMLDDYWDKQLPLLIRFGFPLDFGIVHFSVITKIIPQQTCTLKIFRHTLMKKFNVRQPLTDNQVRRHFAQILSKLNLQNTNLTFHAFWRSGATYTFNSNVHFAAYPEPRHLDIGMRLEVNHT